MSINEIKSKKLYKEFLIEIPFEDIDEEINSKIKKLIPTVSIPGFRKGKAPLNIVKKKYEDTVLNEVIQSVVSSKTNDLIKEKNFNLFRQPKIEVKNFEKNETTKVELKIDLQPEIKLKDFKELKLNKYEIKLSKKDIDLQFENFIKSQKNFKKITKNRSIKKNDRVILNLNTTNQEVPKYLKSQKNLPVDTGSKYEIISGINKELISKFKEGEKKDVILDLSKETKIKNLNKVKFEVEIVSIEEKVNFEITDDFLNKNGFKNVEELKKYITKNAEQQFQQGIIQIEKKQMMDLLDKQYNFDLPEGILEEDFNEIWKRLEEAKKTGNLDEDDKSLSEKELKNRYEKISERRVKLAVLLQVIANSEKISISQEELSKGIMEYASKYPGQENQIMDYLKKNPNSLESIRGPLLEQKIINTISSKATIKDNKINEEQYKKLEEQTFNIIK